MSNYTKIKKLDIESLNKVIEHPGPADECICTIVAPPEDRGRLASVRQSLKKVFTMGGRSGTGRDSYYPRMQGRQGMRSVDIPLTFTKGGKGIYTKREIIKRQNSCGKCGCDKNSDIALKHSYANIKIISPDISSICPCASDCLPEKAKLANNITVTMERLALADGIGWPASRRDSSRDRGRDPDDDESEFSEEDIHLPQQQMTDEPVMEKRSITQLIESQYDADYVFSKFSAEDY